MSVINTDSTETLAENMAEDFKDLMQTLNDAGVMTFDSSRWDTALSDNTTDTMKSIVEDLYKAQLTRILLLVQAAIDEAVGP